jgi:CHAT domain-containing protein
VFSQTALSYSIRDKAIHDSAELSAGAERIMKHAFGDNCYEVGLAKNNLAVAYTVLNRGDEATKLRHEIARSCERTLGKDHPQTLRSRQVEAIDLIRRGDDPGAIEILEHVVASRKQAVPMNTEETITSMRTLADAYARVENLVAEAAIRKELSDYEQVDATRSLSHGTDATDHGVFRGEKANADAAVMLALRLPSAARPAYEAVLRIKNGILSAGLSRLAQLRERSDPTSVHAFESLREDARNAATLAYEGPTDNFIKAYGDYETRTKALWDDVYLHVDDFQSVPVQTSLESVVQALPANAVLVDFYKFAPAAQASDLPISMNDIPHPHYAAFLVEKNGTVTVEDLGLAIIIEHQVQAFRDLATRSDASRLEEIERGLFDLLLGPFSAKLDRASSIIVSPDGPLALIPLASLVDNQGALLVKRFQISYVLSARDLTRENRLDPATSGMYVIAAPDFGGDADKPISGCNSLISLSRGTAMDGLIFCPLQGALLEAQALKTMFNLDDAHVLVGPAANKVNLAKIARPSILHIATHGFLLDEPQSLKLARKESEDYGDRDFSSSAMLRSGLALANANLRAAPRGGEGILTAAELATWDLRGTKLVVLSACETGLGVVSDLDDFFGFRRAIFAAGAESQLTTLWKIGDAANLEMLKDYYSHLLRDGQGRAQALRSAQLDWLRNNPAYRQPYYWAGLVIVGDTTPITLH